MSRGRLLVLLSVGALVLSGCGGPGLPESVEEGTSVRAAWAATLTTANPAVAGATPGDLEVAALTRGRIARTVEGSVQRDPEFGTATIVGKAPFRVRYDLARPDWSDGIPVDASDLLLAWAAGTDREAGFTPSGDDLRASDRLAAFDESERAIEVSFETPEPEWETALDVAVPAHVVGQLAFGTDDPMEAKKQVSDAIRDKDRSALARIAKVWNTGFAIGSSLPDAPTVLSNGPYQLEKVSRQQDGGQEVTLVVNRRYVGSQVPTYERITVNEKPEADRLEALGDGDDVVRLTPTVANRLRVRNLEREEHTLSTASDGTLWTVVLRADAGIFQGPKAGKVFLSNVPRDTMVETGAGGWADAYTSSDSLLFDPGSTDYQIAVEDSGFQDKLARGGGIDDLKSANLTRATARVCLGYDSSSEFARGAYRGMKEGMAEAGWTVSDCGKRGFTDFSSSPQATAMLIRIPITEDPDVLTRRWGGDQPLPGLGQNARDTLLTELAQTTDRFDFRDVRVKVETDLVNQAVALPIAMNANVALSVPGVSGVALQPGPVAPLLSRAVEWTPTR